MEVNTGIGNPLYEKMYTVGELSTPSVMVTAAWRGEGGDPVVAVQIIIIQCICKLVMILTHKMLITCSSWITTLGRLSVECE